ncbi:hypothetical protein F3Y22_tig00112130pilonHSYRG00058 [Hibiscus syriacus]|uniref:Uncharacterized protein n=1 Tax=Hibiscus syriacus TaxID=106335 RepID=A0A6A2Y406_HIBSY|nr:hypothetical protein F3Y22_tig00112130pilonHSYRG00058 [Hibiscus syriacus]
MAFSPSTYHCLHPNTENPCSDSTAQRCPLPLKLTGLKHLQARCHRHRINQTMKWELVELLALFSV